jgi:hypothetical protein
VRLLTTIDIVLPCGFSSLVLVLIKKQNGIIKK